MKASNPLWKERLEGRLPAPLAEEIDTFEMEIDLRRQGKVDEKVFAETRLRRSALMLGDGYLHSMHPNRPKGPILFGMHPE